MQENQETIGAWARETFPGGDDLSPRHCLRLLEEVVELCLAAGATHREVYQAAADQLIKSGAKGTLMGGIAEQPAYVQHPDKVAAEMADCAIVLDVLAERRGVDLQAEVDLKMAINRERKWKSNGDGTGYHIKESQ